MVCRQLGWTFIPLKMSNTAILLKLMFADEHFSWCILLEISGIVLELRGLFLVHKNGWVAPVAERLRACFLITLSSRHCVCCGLEPHSGHM